MDYAFKRVYGREENRDVLASILEAVLAGTEFATITDLEILNPFNERATADDKLSIVDVRARQKSGEVFNVEMQLLPFKAMQQRLLDNWSVSHAEQLDKGNSYADLKPNIMICFADYDVFPGRSGWHSRFRVIDSEGRLFCHDLEIHVLELPKFTANPNIVATPLEQWLFFLREADHELYRARRKQALDEHSLRYDAISEGKEIGKEIGIEIGIEIRLIASRIHSLEALLGREPTPVAQLRLRSTVELQQIEAELKAKLANRS